MFAFDSSVCVCVCVSCIVHHARPLRHRRLVPQAIPETPFCAARIGHIQSVVILAWSLFRIERVQYCISTVDYMICVFPNISEKDGEGIEACNCKPSLNTRIRSIIGGFLSLTYSYSRECPLRRLRNTGDGSCWIPGGWDDERSSGGWFRSISVQLTGPTEQCQMLQVHMID